MPPEDAPPDYVLPCLLDRLCNDHPGSRQESRNQRVVSMSAYRESVRRDIGWRLNSKAPRPEDGLAEDEAASSVANYGLPDLCGRTASGVSADEMARQMRRTLLNFEPRIIPSSLMVTAITDADDMSYRAVSFEIRGKLDASPVPQELNLRTAVDLETGRWETEDQRDG